MNWPCGRRDAHKSHARTYAGWMLPATSETNAPAYWLGDGTKTTDPECPGVKAHPDTMIGRQHHDPA